MLSRNGVQLGTSYSLAGPKFFIAVYRLSRVGPRKCCHSRIAYIRHKYIFSSQIRISKSEHRAARHHGQPNHPNRLFSSTSSASSERPNADPGSSQLRLSDNAQEPENSKELDRGRNDPLPVKGRRTVLRAQQLNKLKEQMRKEIEELAKYEKERGTQPELEPFPEEEADGLSEPLSQADIAAIEKHAHFVPTQKPKHGKSTTTRGRKRHEFDDPSPTFDMRDVSVKKLNTTEISSQPSAPILKKPINDEVRGIMRNVPQSVVALTTTLHSVDPIYSPELARGMLISSLTTVTLESLPVISFNIKTPSHTLEALKMSRHFLVHFLAGSEPGAKLAHDLTLPYGLQTVFKGNKHDFWQSLDIKPIPIKTERNGREEYVVLPLLYGKGLKGPILRCEVLKEGPGYEEIKNGILQVGDHAVIFAKVEEVLQGHDNSEKTRKELRMSGDSLTYYGGGYHAFTKKERYPKRQSALEKRKLVMEMIAEDEGQKEVSDEKPTMPSEDVSEIARENVEEKAEERMEEEATGQAAELAEKPSTEADNQDQTSSLR